MFDSIGREAAVEVSKKKRRIIVVGVIEPELVYAFVTAMEELKCAKKPISVLLFSPGGDYTATLAMYDAIKVAKVPVTVIVVGEASSGAAVLMQAADRRLMTKNARIMLHDGNIGMNADVKAFLSWAQWYQKEHTSMLSLVLQRVNATRKKTKKSPLTMTEMAKIFGKETIFSADDAVELGLVDGIYTGDR